MRENLYKKLAVLVFRFSIAVISGYKVLWSEFQEYLGVFSDILNNKIFKEKNTDPITCFKGVAGGSGQYRCQDSKLST